MQGLNYIPNSLLINLKRCKTNLFTVPVNVF